VPHEGGPVAMLALVEALVVLAIVLITASVA
jgi:hypothetical protein